MASALPSSRGTKRSGEPLVGENRISSLFRPELVSIFVRVDTGREKGKKAVKEDVEYQVPRGLVRGLSEDFDKAFDDTFVEGKTGKIELHIFADKYDTRRLRNKVMELIQIKSFLVEPTIYLRPSDLDNATVYNSLPESSGLSKFMVDLQVYSTVPPRSEAEYDGTLPPRMLYRLMSQATQLARCFRCADCTTGQPCDCRSHRDIKSTKAPYVGNLCAYHEHETEEEKKLCIQRWVQLRIERDLSV
ncbi:hypothetical protein LTR15_010027 [Elasticomyces elasticus]|nr:hypothetical protein LTR15_010027 [Elasticomyces elasticus]